MGSFIKENTAPLKSTHKAQVARNPNVLETPGKRDL